MKSAGALLAALEGLVDAHARGLAPSEAQWRTAIGALAQAKGEAAPVTPAAAYPEKIRITDGDAVADFYREGRNGHLWIEMTGAPPPEGADAFICMPIGHEDAERLLGILQRMVAEAR